LYTQQNFSEILYRYIQNECTPEEAEQVLHWLGSENITPDQKKMIHDLLTASRAPINIDKARLQQILSRNEELILTRIDTPVQTIKPYSTFSWLRLGAAAILFAAIGVAAYRWLNKPPQTDNRATAATRPTPAKKNITAGGNKAVLTLGNGTQVILDEAKNGNVASQGNITIIKIDGKLAYEKKGAANEVMYNTITTPRGGQYQLELADGSKVWLNASSSLRFPTAFPGQERMVELTGEGYFEVAKNTAQPFSVKVNNMQVEVLGTHFNIMAYADERAVNTTLLEGSVKIKTGNTTSLLKPGQQARLQQNNIKIADDVDVDEVVAWKNGYFQFERNAGIEQVMRQIARWYDVEITYEDNIPKRSFGGKISRDLDLQETLKVLELSKIHCTINGRKLIVKK
jgi:transmembrane sensor